MIETLELFLHALDLSPRSGALLLVEFYRFGASQSLMRALQNCRRHLQIADDFGSWLGWLCFLPLGFEKQRRIVQNALPNRGRSLAPRRIQQAGLARIAALLGEDCRHALTLVQILPCRRRQKLHRHLRADLAVAHLLLDRFRKQFD